MYNKTQHSINLKYTQKTKVVAFWEHKRLNVKKIIIRKVAQYLTRRRAKKKLKTFAD